MTKFALFTILCLLIIACESDTSEDDSKINDTIEKSEEEKESETIQEQEEEPLKDTLEKTEAENPDLTDSKKEIEKKYGTQWDFCTCILKRDSVTNAMLAEDISDEEFDQLFERSEHIDKKCQELFVQPNNTPEEREKHKKKVNDCLKNK